MKKTTLFFTLLSSAFIGLQAQESKLFLKTIESQAELNEYEEFFYDSKGLLDSISIRAMQNETDVTVFGRKLIRDDNGNIILNKWYQFIDFVNVHTAKIEYKYDENNRLIERTNYQDYGAGMVKQFPLRYYYNGSGLLLKREQVSGWDETLIEYSEYEYDDKGRLISETITDVAGEEPGVKQKLEYSYNENDLVSKLSTMIVNAVGQLYESQKTEYTYDDAGNLIETNDFLNKGGAYQAAGRVKYVYDMSVGEGNIIYPFNDLDKFDTAEMLNLELNNNCHNKVIRDTIMVEFEGEWGLVDIRDYVYESATVSISEVKDNVNSELAVVINNGFISLNGVKNGELVQIYDSNGNLLVVSDYNNGISVSGLPNGVKIVKVGNRVAKFL